MCLKMGGLFAAVLGFYSNQLKTELRFLFTSGMKPRIDCLQENKQSRMAVPHVPVKMGTCTFKGNTQNTPKRNHSKSLENVSWVRT